jgi:hypothetical protein
MPPNMFSNPRGRGKGGNKAAVLAVVPPVHSLASAKPDILDIQNMSLAEKVNLLTKNKHLFRISVNLSIKVMEACCITLFLFKKVCVRKKYILCVLIITL